MKKSIILIALGLLLLAKTQEATAQSDQSSSQLLLREQTDTFRLLSWNIYMLPFGVMITGKRKRANVIGKMLSSGAYDVLVFQEAFLHGARRRINRHIKEVYPYQSGPAFRKKFSFKTSSGIWIASKHPMTVIDQVKFRRKEGFDNKMARKGALMVSVNKNGQTFHIIGTHLNAGGSLDTRSSQVRQIREELIDQHHRAKADEVPLVVAGDFNIEQKLAAGLDSMTCILDLGIYDLNGCYQLTYDGIENDLQKSKKQGIIDFIYFDHGNLELRQLLRFVPNLSFQWSKKHISLSDHNPVELYLQYMRE